MMNIALCTDETFVIPCLTCIVSIFENNKDSLLNIYVLTDGLSEKSYQKFQRLSNVYGQNIVVKLIDVVKIRSLKTRGSFPTSMYFRFLLPEILNKEHKVLYFDCDIIVRHSLNPLYNFNISGFSCAAVEDQHSDDILLKNNTHTQNPYFNSGVLLMNLDYWRENNIAERLINFVYDNPERCVYPDQDALNIVLDGTINYLPYSFNFQHYWLVNFDMAKIDFGKHKRVLEASSNPCIVHFNKEKPWWTRCHNPYTKEYEFYNELHPFVGKVNPHRRIKLFFYRLFNRLSITLESMRDLFKE